MNTMLPKLILILIGVFSATATAAITYTVFTRGPIQVQNDPSQDRLPGLYPMIGFTLTDQDGEDFGYNDLIGKVWVANTIFTRCNAICPTMTAGMRQVQDQLKQDERFEQQVRLVSFSVDGENDTPQVLSAYAKAHGADTDYWHFLTGERDATWPLIRNGLRLPVDEPGPDDTMAISHTGKLVLIDSMGVIRGYYDGLTAAGRASLIVDLKKVLDETFDE